MSGDIFSNMPEDPSLGAGWILDYTLQNTQSGEQASVQHFLRNILPQVIREIPDYFDTNIEANPLVQRLGSFTSAFMAVAPFKDIGEAEDPAAHAAKPRAQDLTALPLSTVRRLTDALLDFQREESPLHDAADLLERTSYAQPHTTPPEEFAAGALDAVRTIIGLVEHYEQNAVFPSALRRFATEHVAQHREPADERPRQLTDNVRTQWYVTDEGAGVLPEARIDPNNAPPKDLKGAMQWFLAQHVRGGDTSMQEFLGNGIPEQLRYLDKWFSGAQSAEPQAAAVEKLAHAMVEIASAQTPEQISKEARNVVRKEMDEAKINRGALADAKRAFATLTEAEPIIPEGCTTVNSYRAGMWNHMRSMANVMEDVGASLRAVERSIGAVRDKPGE